MGAISRHCTRSKNVPGSGTSRLSSSVPWDTASSFFGGILGVGCIWWWWRVCAPRTWEIGGSGYPGRLHSLLVAGWCCQVGRTWWGDLLYLWWSWYHISWHWNTFPSSGPIYVVHPDLLGIVTDPGWSRWIGRLSNHLQRGVLLFRDPRLTVGRWWIAKMIMVPALFLAGRQSGLGPGLKCCHLESLPTCAVIQECSNPQGHVCVDTIYPELAE